MLKYIGPVTWAWMIIIGVLMITPGGVECIACGSVLTNIIGIVSVILGVVAFVVNRRAVGS
jgi:hypothetical protein